MSARVRISKVRLKEGHFIPQTTYIALLREGGVQRWTKDAEFKRTSAKLWVRVGA